MRTITFTREAPLHHEDGPSYEILVDGEYVGEITTEMTENLSTGGHVIAAYLVELLDADQVETFGVTREIRDWGTGRLRHVLGFPTARAALAAAKSFVREEV